MQVAPQCPFTGLNSWASAEVRDLEKDMLSDLDGCSHFTCPSRLSLEESRFLGT